MDSWRAAGPEAPIALGTTRAAVTIEIEKFVPREEIDPRYMETPYYIAPDDRAAQEAFAVIRECARQTRSRLDGW